MIENGTYLARTHPGLESLLKSELKKAGATYLFESEGSVRFQAEDEALYTYLLGTGVTTGLELLLSKPVEISKADITALTSMVDWTNVIPLHSVFGVTAYHNGSTGPSALKTLASELEKSICRVFEHTFESAPKPARGEEEPEFVINIQISGNGSCLLTLDAGGSVLSKRAVIHEKNAAVVSPALAAGIIKMSGWNGKTPFLDPFANNGAFLIEAARIAKHRTPLFEDDSLLMKKWRIFRHALWKKKREEVVARMRKDVDWILGSDSSYENISKIQYLSRVLRLNNNIKLRVAKPNTIYYPKTPGYIITAPPPAADLRLLGDFARKTKMFAGNYHMGIFSPLANIDTVMGMKPSLSKKLQVNGREYTYQQFEIFQADAKSKPEAEKKSRPGSKPQKPRKP